MRRIETDDQWLDRTLQDQRVNFDREQRERFKRMIAVNGRDCHKLSRKMAFKVILNGG